ncbi:MAG TPA: glycoside hydrolase family 3 N-terminal domain-containing protein [Ignavibacteria bacterium]|nr:glycoside hydrolase family 3 N-terminal domain-containing protein [Ignavibacteria bacterium]
MKIIISFLVLSLLYCGNKVEGEFTEAKDIPTIKTKKIFTLSDFYSDDKSLDEIVEREFNLLSDYERVGQMLVSAAGVYGKSEAEINGLIERGSIGGVLLLKGDRDEFSGYINRFDETSVMNNKLPLIYSADAEPSLINKKISGFPEFQPTNTLKTKEETKQSADEISRILFQMGISQNYAPVVDLGINTAIIGNRAFGTDVETITTLAKEFIKTSQDIGIIATAKHFPGHGNVKGDSHKNVVYIDGDMKEIEIYESLIKSGVISIMIGHIAIKNNKEYNTNGVPSTLSYNIVTGLLKEEMGFKGLIITDAMNMGAVSKIKSASLKAIEAGCDMILMPENEDRLINSVLEKMGSDEKFRERIYESTRKIIRAKICLGLIS